MHFTLVSQAEAEHSCVQTGKNQLKVDFYLHLQEFQSLQSQPCLLYLILSLLRFSVSSRAKLRHKNLSVNSFYKS